MADNVCQPYAKLFTCISHSIYTAIYCKGISLLQMKQVVLQDIK